MEDKTLLIFYIVYLSIHLPDFEIIANFISNFLHEYLLKFYVLLILFSLIIVIC